jgi:tetratricopeptide (TPR) repeat protein
MAKISLRAYNRDIEALIEQGRNDEAIVHCRHILKKFPKCLDTYRLLGKGYLEARRFTEAEDILKRLLLAVPDDFIGNLGMSILFDEQKNINNAIWHMERAFEVQPSNTAIQGELRRLYGRRDGLEPPQIRLTRGALAQMYARGNQIPQAIAEIRAMLTEDADRMDLLVLLARVYFRGGQKVEATDTCTTLLKKYPYCLDANRIMVEILTDTSRNDSTQIYRHRVNALEPYSAFATGSLFAAGDVPDGAVILEQLDLEASEFTSPTDLGLSLVDEQAQAPAEEGPESPETAEPSAAPAEEIPEWLKAAGWGAATAEAVRRAEQAAHDENMEADANTQAADELAEGEVPDWLKIMAPPEATQTPEAGALAEDVESAEADTDWLAGLGMPEGAETDSSSDVTKVGMGLTGAVVAAAAGAMLNKSDDEEKISAEEPESGLAAPAPEAGAMEEPGAGTGEGELPDWMQETVVTEPGAQAEELETAEADMDWLAGLGSAEQAETESSPDATQVGMGPSDAAVAATAAAAAAMLSKSDDEASIFAEEPESEPVASGPELGASATEEPTATTGEAELPDWLQETTVADSASGAEPPAEEVPDWLKEAAVVGAVSEAEAPAGEAPDLSKDFAGEEAQPESESGPGELGPWGTAAAVAAMAASLSGEESGPEEVPEGEAEPQSGEPAADVSEWLASLDQADEVQVQAVDQAGEDAPAAEAASEPGGEIEPAAEPAAEVGLEPAMQESDALTEPPAGAEEPAPSEVTPEAVAQMSEDDAFAWLESLAAKQGVDPDQLLTKPEERSETAPEWLTQPEIGRDAETPGVAGVILGAAAVGEMLTPEHEPEAVTPEPEKLEESVAGEMEWLEGIEEQGTVAETEGQTPAVAEWLPVESAAEGAATGTPEPEGEETLEQNLASTSLEPNSEVSEAAESGAQPGAEEEMPDWLRTSLEETPSTPEEDVPEWMKASDDAQASADEELETSLVEAELAAAVEASPAGTESGIEIARRTPPEGDDAIFEQAQIDLQRGNLEQATLGYKSLIRKGKLLDEIIFDLREGTYQHPVDVVIWLTLGDAYRRANRLQEALDAYTKAEALLR